MKLLGIDVGSSSVKAGILDDGTVIQSPARVEYATRVDGASVEVDAETLLSAVAKAIEKLGARVRRVDAIALAGMAPSWVAMDKRGRALTGIVTHQDRRSVAEAKEIEKRVGKRRHLKLAGNRPFPGGISSTTWLWHRRHRAEALQRADLVGHVTTFLLRRLCDARVTDPSNASFTGVYSTLDLSGWSEELCHAIGAKRSQLPDIRESNEIGGRITREAVRRFGIAQGTPVFAGMMDTSAVLLLVGAEAGRVVNSCGSSDVLAVCTDRPMPHERLLTRAVGIGKKWMSVSTLAAAGTSIAWAKEHLFADLSWDRFNRLLAKLASAPSHRAKGDGAVTFEPHLAGDRASIEQRRGAFTGLTLATTREAMLSAVIESLAFASAARVDRLREANPSLRFHREVCLTGGASPVLRRILHRDWPGKWHFHEETEATLRGLAR